MVDGSSSWLPLEFKTGAVAREGSLINVFIIFATNIFENDSWLVLGSLDLQQNLKSVDIQIKSNHVSVSSAEISSTQSVEPQPVLKTS